MSKLDKHHLFAILAAGVVVFFFAWILRKPRGPWTRRPAFLAAGFGFALLMMQSSLVRSDHAHLLIGAYAMTFLGGGILLDEVDGPPWIPATLGFMVVVATVALAKPVPVFLPANVAAQLRQVVRPAFLPVRHAGVRPGCSPARGSTFAQCLRIRGFQRLAQFAARGLPLPDRPRYCFAARHCQWRAAELPPQWRLPHWSRDAALDRPGPPPVYISRTPLSEPVDGVPNFTRSPDVWFYYLRHYRAAGRSPPPSLDCRADDARTPALDSPPRVVGNAPETVPNFKTQYRARPWSCTLGLLTAPTSSTAAQGGLSRLVASAQTILPDPGMSFADGSRNPIQLVVPARPRHRHLDLCRGTIPGWPVTSPPRKLTGDRQTALLSPAYNCSSPPSIGSPWCRTASPSKQSKRFASALRKIFFHEAPGVPLAAMKYVAKRISADVNRNIAFYSRNDV